MNRRSSITLYNLAPLAWPVWLWGPTPAAVLTAAAVLAVGYIWNAFVLAGLLLILRRTEQVGQKGLLVGALWATLLGLAADGVHAYILAGLLSRLDFLLVPDPVATLASTLLVPAAIILLGGTLLGVLAWRLPLGDCLGLGLGLALLTPPWLALIAVDVGAPVMPYTVMTGILLMLALAALAPWLLLAAGAWADDSGRRAGPAHTLVAVVVGTALGLLGAQTVMLAQPTQPQALPGRLAVALRGRVYIVDGPTGQRSLLTTDPGELVAWSPDGTRILLQREVSATTWIQVMDTTTGRVTPLVKGRVLPTAWSPDGQSILFTTDRPAPQEGLIWRLRLGQSPVEITAGTAPCWSPDGRRVAFSARAGGRSQVWVMNPDGSDIIQLTTDGGEDPAWSPDGERIAYAFNGRVYVMAADGSGKRQVTTGDELFDRNPVLRWSPDGKRLAYAQFQPPQGPRQSVVYVLKLDSGARERFAGDYQPPLAWSPDAQWLALMRHEEVWGLHISDRAWRQLSPGSNLAWGGSGAPVTVKPAPTYPPTPTPTPLPPAVMESPDVLVVNPKDSSVLYAGTPHGAMKRTASGGWGAASQGLAYPLRVRAIALDPANPDTLYAGTDGERGQQGGSLYKSTDGGLHWTATSLRDLDVYVIAVDPLNPSVVYAGTLKGVYKSTDAGATWRSSSTGLKTAAVQALALDSTPPRGERLTASVTLYAGTRQGDLYKSTDSAATWTLLDSRDVPVTALATSPQRPSMVFAATAEGLLRTTDGGAHWGMMAGGIWRFKLDGVAIDPRNPAVVYVVGPAGVFKSTDGGENWGPASIGLTGTQPTALAIDPNEPAILYVGTDRGVFRSRNAGVTWER
jgi:photosystem II stability/assembly factor-like uncharacterized protein